MRFATLGSGSSGNATLICSEKQTVLLDCGFALRELERRMAQLQMSVTELSAVLITHEHSDHCKGVGALARKYRLPVYMTPGTYVSRDYGRIPDLRYVEGYRPFSIGDINITPVAVPHDAREPAQYLFSIDGIRLGVLTDLGCITPHVVAAYQHCDALILEANHDPSLLSIGPYPPSLKRRVGGDWGHLSNQQARQLLDAVQAHRIQQLVVAHMSEKNNCLVQVQEALGDIDTVAGGVHYARQDDVSPWFVIKSTIVG